MASREADPARALSRSAGKLKVAQVDCSKHADLCTDFGVAGDSEDTSGYPTPLWFRAGELQAWSSATHARPRLRPADGSPRRGTPQGAYDGERTTQGLEEWAKAWEAEGALTQ